MLDIKRMQRTIERIASETVDDARCALRRGARAAEEVGAQVVAEGKRFGKRAHRVGKDVAGDLADAVSTQAQWVEHRVRHERGDRVLRNFPRPLQLDDYSCGVQCTMAILEFFGVERLEGELRRELGTTKRYGTATDSIIDVLRRHGCHCTTFERGRRETLSRAIRSGAPVLVEVDGDHWAVVYGMGRVNVYLADPSMVRSPGVVVPWREFRDRWDRAGVVARRRSRR